MRQTSGVASNANRGRVSHVPCVLGCDGQATRWLGSRSTRARRQVEAAVDGTPRAPPCPMRALHPQRWSLTQRCMTGETIVRDSRCVGDIVQLVKTDAYDINNFVGSSQMTTQYEEPAWRRARAVGSRCGCLAGFRVWRVVV